MVGWHAKEITQALCGSMKKKLKADEMWIEEKLESNQKLQWSVARISGQSFKSEISCVLSARLATDG